VHILSIRRPCVAGTFYPADPNRLVIAIESCFTNRLGPGELPKLLENKRRIVSIICPHAGYIYSGPVAAHGFYHLASESKPDSIVILGPNHTGLGGPVSMWGEGRWITPLGDVEVDAKLAKAIFEASDLISYDESAHIKEHSIEVQLPFLQYVYGKLKFVPICMGFQDLETSRNVGEAIAEASGERDILILASTDLTHREHQSDANKKDRGVLDRIVSLDESSLQNWIKTQKVSMCGYGPVSATIVASKKMSAKQVQVLSYQTSGDVSGDKFSVVGYAAAKIFK